MKKFFWKLAYTLHLKNLGDMPLIQGWKQSSAAYDDNEFYELEQSAYEAAQEEVSCWD